MAKIKILLDKTEPSKRLHVLALDSDTHCYLNVKISLAVELVNRNYKDILNAFMIFRIDFCDAFSEAKSNEKFRKNLGSFKDTSFLWKISPKDVTDVYEQVFTEFKKLKPKKLSFITCYPQESKSRELDFGNSEVTYDQVNLRNNIFLSETENPEIMQDQDYLSDNINCSTSQSQYDEPELDNSEAILDIDNSNTNDLNSTIQFGNTEVSDNLYSLSGESNYLIPQGPEFDNFETTLDQFNINNINMISETNQFDSSEVTNIDYNIPQLQYLSSDNAAYNMAYNLGCEYFDSSRSMTCYERLKLINQPIFIIIQKNIYFANTC
ncbi:unnamed protein product [Rhizophagus irregularis]|nr:unnamed protein product [Rhizophagus irregularis]